MFTTALKLTRADGKIYWENFDASEFEWAIEEYLLAKHTRSYTIEEGCVLKPLISVELYNAEIDKKFLPLGSK